ncbi:hypothetical protein KZ287_33220, partial [Escherichia coli]|nr:hypothetical protein [Escherichia coli]
TTQFNGTNLLDGKTTNIQFQISPEAPSLALKLAKIGDVTTATLGLTTTSITTATNATTAITQLDKAIAAVSKDRSTLG